MAHVPSREQRAATQAKKLAKKQADHAIELAIQPLLERKLQWLEVLNDLGFLFTRIHGIDPFNRIEIGGKSELQCLCWIGQKGEECGRSGKHATDCNPVKNSGFVSNYTAIRARRLIYSSWGVLTGKTLPDGNRFLVIDVDVHKGGQESLNECIDRIGPLPPTFRVDTGTGGYHLYFRYDASHHIQSRANHKNLGAGLDVKAYAGFVITPGCLHKCGGWYTVNEGSDIKDAASAAMLPEAWIDEVKTIRREDEAERESLTPEQIAEFNRQHQADRESGNDSPSRRYVERALEDEVNDVLCAIEGTRNQTLNDAAYNLSRYIPTGLLTHDEVYSCLFQAALSVGLDAVSANKTILSGIAGGKAKPKTVPQREYYDEFAEFAEVLDGLVATSGATGIPEVDDDPDTFNIQKRQLTAVQRLEIDLRHSLHQPRSAILDETPVPVAIVHNPTIHPLRCAKCNPLTHKRPCALCATRLAVTRPRPDDAPCTNGGRFLIKSKNKKKRHKLAGFCPKCCMWGCPKCGYDNEVDHLQNMAVYAQWLIDELDQPVITLQSHDIENPKTEEVPVQHGCYKLILNEENRRKYSNKLTKLRTYFVVDYIGNDNYVFFVFLPLNINPSRLAYTPTGSNGQKLSPLTPTVITFEEFRTEHRLHISNAGRYVKLRKSDWEMCDKLPGARKRHVAVAYCKALRLPKRMISTEENERIDNIVRTEEEVLQDALEFGCTASFGDTREIDRSHRRGLTQCLMKYWRFEFPEDVSDARMNAFIARLTGKEKKKVEVASMGDVASNAQQNTSTGSRCLTYPLIT